jgi:hypothetical protein
MAAISVSMADFKKKLLISSLHTNPENSTIGQIIVIG